MRRLFKGLLAGVVLISVGAGPTTKPAETKKPIPANWPTVENKAYHFNYRIPTSWNKKLINDSQSEWDLPTPDKNEKDGRFILTAAPCHRATFEQNVQEQREAFVGQVPNGKLTVDEETTLGSRRAWILTIETPHVVNETRQVGNNPPVVIQHKSVFYRTRIFTNNEATSYIINVAGITPIYNKNREFFKMVTDSFEWAEQSATKS